jgi:hypothetical protein
MTSLFTSRSPLGTKPNRFVESGWSGVTKHNARKQFCCAHRPHQLGHLADDLGTVTAPVVTLVNEQLPQEPRPDDLPVAAARNSN